MDREGPPGREPSRLDERVCVTCSRQQSTVPDTTAPSQTEPTSGPHQGGNGMHPSEPDTIFPAPRRPRKGPGKLTRYRTALTVERSREAQRLEKELEDAGIKISAVATDILGVSGRAMLTALIDGQDDAQVMAEMARGRMRPKIPALVQALTGSFGEHHSFLCRMHLTRIDELSATIEELSARIDQEMRPFAPQIERLVTIPGVKKTTAEVIIAETGADMTRFRTPANLASWAGVRKRVM